MLCRVPTRARAAVANGRVTARLSAAASVTHPNRDINGEVFFSVQAVDGHEHFILYAVEMGRKGPDRHPAESSPSVATITLTDTAPTTMPRHSFSLSLTLALSGYPIRDRDSDRLSLRGRERDRQNVRTGGGCMKAYFRCLKTYWF